MIVHHIQWLNFYLCSFNAIKSDLKCTWFIALWCTYTVIKRCASKRFEHVLTYFLSSIPFNENYTITTELMCFGFTLHFFSNVFCFFWPSTKCQPSYNWPYSIHLGKSWDFLTICPNQSSCCSLTMASKLAKLDSVSELQQKTSSDNILKDSESF